MASRSNWSWIKSFSCPPPPDRNSKSGVIEAIREDLMADANLAVAVTFFKIDPSGIGYGIT